MHVVVPCERSWHPGEESEPGGGEKHRVRRFLPFSVGPRDCIGQNLAKLNYQTTVPMLLAHFSFRLADEVDLTPNTPIL